MWKSLITIFCATGTVLSANGPQRVSVLPNSEQSACPEGFVSLGDKNDCYYVSSEVASWLDAHFICQDKNATLAELWEMEMNERMKEYLINQQSDHFERWIGARYNWGNRTWEWGITGKNYTYDGFGDARSETNLVDGQWHCVVMNPERRYDWAPKSCFENKHFICHKRDDSTVPGIAANEPQNIQVPPQSQNHVRTTSACPDGFVLLGKRNCFYVSPGVANWLNSQFFCQDRNATLAELPKKHLNRKLKKYLMERAKYQRSSGFESWIGARYNWNNKAWEWGITGRNITYDGFSRLRSEIHRVDEQWECAVMNPERNYNWAARSCIEEKHYICRKRANLTGKKNKKAPNGRRIKKGKNKKENFGSDLIDRNEILPLNQREFRTTIKRSGPKWNSNEQKPKKHFYTSLTRWAPGSEPSDRLRPVKSKDPTVPEQWVSRKKAEIMTSNGNFIKGSDEELLPIPPSPAGIAPTLSDDIETETGNMLTQFDGGHMFL